MGTIVSIQCFHLQLYHKFRTFLMNLGGLSLTSVTVIFNGTEVVRELGATSLAIEGRKKVYSNA